MNGRWQEELDTALETAWAGGRATLRWFQTGVEAERKADGSPVTVADREAEAAMRAVLRRRFPADGILGEEGGEEAAGSGGRRWILDPIDGTRSFVRGVPLYGVMVALEADGEPVVGVLHFPALNETVAAARGLGCRWNGRRCRVSPVDRIEEALVVTSGDDRSSRRAAALDRLGAWADSYRTWGDCYGYALVATGRAEAMLDPVLNIWDAAAVRPVIEEAGGVFTDWSDGDGVAAGPVHAAGHAIATNGALAEAVRMAVRPDTEERP